ncbi:MAG TPA: hypothetical protein ENK01_04770 [Hellea balneolensis]|uniref:DUF2282 domain-containing protein n=1 Tax=Hellea balneolensis TaxID=287478 RepID=A0A7V5U1L2_9PROT|nr:hypothetical protein [Hellea balneolensis]
MGIAKFGAGFAITAMALGTFGLAHADFVKTVKSESECLAQDGTIVNVRGAKHCLVPVIPEEFQGVEYAGELRGVTSCKKKDTRKTQIGDFCVIALEPIPARNVAKPVAPAPTAEAPKMEKGKK